VYSADWPEHVRVNYNSLPIIDRLQNAAALWATPSSTATSV
jgi:hypothetical protein